MSQQQWIRDERKKIQAKKSADSLTQSAGLTGLTAPFNAQAVASLQTTVGNAAVQRMLIQRSADTGGTLDEETANAINQQRGSGATLDSGMASKVGGVMGADLSGVKVHTDSSADSLSQSIGAKAFTTGNDIFFRDGAYNPHSSDGQHLIAHELTHVVQQGASTPSVQGKMTVNDPHDQYETEADSVADVVMSQSAEPVQLEALPEEEEELMQRQEIEEEEEGLV